MIIKYSLFWLFYAKFVTKYNKAPQSRARNLWLILGEKALYNPLFTVQQSSARQPESLHIHSAKPLCNCLSRTIIRQEPEIVHRLVEMWD